MEKDPLVMKSAFSSFGRVLRKIPFLSSFVTRGYAFSQEEKRANHMGQADLIRQYDTTKVCGLSAADENTRGVSTCSMMSSIAVSLALKACSANMAFRWLAGQARRLMDGRAHMLHYQPIWTLRPRESIGLNVTLVHYFNLFFAAPRS
jgi:hypothetical protein